MCQMSVTFSKSKGLYKDGIRIQCFFKHDVSTSALSVCRHDNGFITLDYHDDNGVHFIEVTDKDVDFLMSCDDSQTAFDYALSLIPPSENTGTKNDLHSNENDPLKLCVSDVSHDLQGLDQARSGVVDSVGDALFSQSELYSLAYILNNIDMLKFANDEKEFSELQQLTEKVNELSFSYYHPQTCKHCKKNKITYLQAKSLGVCGACEFLNTDTYWNSVAHESGIFTGTE